MTWEQIEKKRGLKPRERQQLSDDIERKIGRWALMLPTEQEVETRAELEEVTIDSDAEKVLVKEIQAAWKIK